MFGIDEWQAMLLCMFFGISIPLYIASHQPLDNTSVSKKGSKTLCAINYITRPIFTDTGYTNVGHAGWMGPVVSMTLCVAFSLYFHYDNTTQTHCDVPNPLPSISAAVGNNLPERWFFRYGILFMSHQRLLDGLIQYNWLQRALLPIKQYQVMNYMMLYFHYFENLALFTIAFVSSTEYYPIHEKAFILWAFFQQLKMVFQLYLGSKVLNHPGGPYWERKSFTIRLGLWAFNTICLFIAGFVFYTHINNCIPYLYALYALLEYMIVGSNVLFNCCVLADWPDLWLTVVTHNPNKVDEDRDGDKLASSDHMRINLDNKESTD